MDDSGPKVCVISFPTPSALVVNVFLVNLIGILEPICKRIYVVTSNIPKDRIFSDKIRIQDVKTALHFGEAIHPMWWSTLLQFFKVIIIQMKMCRVLIKISKKIDIVIIYGGEANLFPPALMAKILRKKVIVVAMGRGSLSYKKSYSKRSFGIRGATFYGIISVLERVNFSLADQIAVETENAVHFLGLDRYAEKISINFALYIDTTLFLSRRSATERRDLVGYIGRFAPGKGIINFVKAIPLILKEHNNVEFLIGGMGPLFKKIREELGNNNLHHKVKLTGWISHDDNLPNYLNELKLLVLPSYSEGLPGIILEAMACSAVVLATPVGGIPGLIKDGETGFILEDNSSEGIAKNIIRALEHPNLDEIVKNARKLIEDEYSYEVMVRTCRDSLDELMKKRREDGEKFKHQ